MGDKSPPVCPGYALRSIASRKMPQTPFPVDPPTVHQGELSKSKQKGPKSPQLFQSFYLFFKFLSPILPKSIMTKPYHFHKSNQLYTKISQGQTGKVLVALMHYNVPSQIFSFALHVSFILPPLSAVETQILFSFPAISYLQMRITENCERVGVVG